MCVVSMIGDGWSKTVPEVYPWVNPPTVTKEVIIQSGVSQEEFDKLKREVEELKLLLLAAKRFDEKTGQPDCEIDEKIELIKKIAKVVGVDMEDVFGKST